MDCQSRLNFDEGNGRRRKHFFYLLSGKLFFLIVS